MEQPRKPDFFVVGAAKSGTSSLHRHLEQHPAVFMPAVKEPHFFSDERPPVQEVKSLREYLALFADSPLGARAGEASTSNLYSPESASRIKAFQPDAGIIMVLRNPVDRAYSQYWNQVHEGVEPLSFEEALEAEWNYVGLVDTIRLGTNRVPGRSPRAKIQSTVPARVQG